MTREERNTKLKHFIACLKCEVSGKECDDNCPVQYEAGNMGEIIENLEAISKALEQEQKTGRWIFTQRNKCVEVSCSECGNTRFKDYTGGYTIDEINDLFAKFHLNFCECCGTKMQ